MHQGGLHAVHSPEYGHILGALALFIALGGTAFAAGATVVNIADPTTPANIAHVDKTGRLQTADSVTNTVTTQLAAPSTYLHTVTVGVVNAKGCVTVATPPAGKAMIVREVRIDVFSDPSPGPDENVAIYTGATCNGSEIADVNPATVGETVLPFDPGAGIPANSGLSGFAGGSVEAEVYADGYSVPSGSVPAAPASAGNAPPQQQQ